MALGLTETLSPCDGSAIHRAGVVAGDAEPHRVTESVAHAANRAVTVAGRFGQVARGAGHLGET